MQILLDSERSTIFNIFICMSLYQLTKGGVGEGGGGGLNSKVLCMYESGATVQ
jgi:hypothetical protein